MLNINLKSYYKELRISVYQLYLNYLKDWHLINANYFDDPIKKFREVITTTYSTDECLVKCITNIPLCFQDDGQYYWDSIIKKSNRYFVELEQHTCRYKDEEKYIRELTTGIYLYLMSDDYIILQNDINIKKLSLYLFITYLRDLFIDIIDILDKYEKKGKEYYEDIDLMFGFALEQIINGDIVSIKTMIKEKFPDIYFKDNQYRFINKVYKCFVYVVKNWNFIKNIPQIHSYKDFEDCVNYCSEIKVDSDYVQGYKIINILINCDEIKQTIDKIMIYDSSLEQKMAKIKFKKLELEKSLDNLKEYTNVLDRQLTPRVIVRQSEDMNENKKQEENHKKKYEKEKIAKLCQEINKKENPNEPSNTNDVKDSYDSSNPSNVNDSDDSNDIEYINLIEISKPKVETRTNRSQSFDSNKFNYTSFDSLPTISSSDNISRNENPNNGNKKGNSSDTKNNNDKPKEKQKGWFKNSGKISFWK